MVVPECESRRECRSALIDSCVDELPVLPVDSVSTRDQVDGLHPDHFETPRRDLTSGSSSLERELCPPADSADVPLLDVGQLVDITPPAELRAGLRADLPEGMNGLRTDDTPEEPPVFVCDTYTDVIGMEEAAREVGRTRNISITWRSISESSNQSSTGFDIADTPHRLDNSAPTSRGTSHESSPLDNHNSTEGDVANHNVVSGAGAGSGSGSEPGSRLHGVNGLNGAVNGVDDVATKFLEVDLNGGATSSSLSSESEGEAGLAPRRSAHVRAARGSQLTLCPTSPRRLACCHCSRRVSATSGIETSGDSGGSTSGCWCGVCGSAAGGARVRCVCGAAGAQPPADPPDGLPPATDPLQARLHMIILHQRKVVEELSGQLREAREALRLSSPAAAASPAAPRAAPDTRHNAQKCSSGSGSGSARSGSSSGSGSASEVEVGEEARGVVWLPDSAAPRCQHCHHHFWLARRRHHYAAAEYSAGRALR